MIHTEYSEDSKILYGMIALHVSEIDATHGDIIELSAVVDNRIKVMRKAVMKAIDERGDNP